MHPFLDLSRLSLGLLAVIGLAQPASAFTAINHHRVNPVPGTAQFEVIGRPGSGPLEYWCAAAEYARLELGQPTRAQVMMVSPLEELEVVLVEFFHLRMDLAPDF